MAEGTDRYTATRLSAELGLDNRKMRDILTRVNNLKRLKSELNSIKADEKAFVAQWSSTLAENTAADEEARM